MEPDPNTLFFNCAPTDPDDYFFTHGNDGLPFFICGKRERRGCIYEKNENSTGVDAGPLPVPHDVPREYLCAGG